MKQHAKTALRLARIAADTWIWASIDRAILRAVYRALGWRDR